MTGLLGRVFDRSGGEGSATVAYGQAKQHARHPDAEVRRQLAARDGARGGAPPEILYYLAADVSPIVRRAIAANANTPRQADRLLAEDVDDEVRCALARKIGRLVPQLSDEEKDQLQRLTLEIVDILAHDQLPRVRQLVAEEIKHCARVPKRIIHDLARDVALIVAAPVLEYSPLLGDDDLLEIIASGPVRGSLSAISRRPLVREPVVDAIAAADDRDAIAALLANPSAQIREETLDSIIDRAPEVESWHRPLVERPSLSVRTICRIANFVALALLRVLEERHDLPPEAAEEVSGAVARRLEESGVESNARPARDAEAEFAAGTLDDECLLAAVDRGDREFAVKALALGADIPLKIVRKVLAAQSAKAVTALAWAAGFSMRTAIQIQLRVAKIAPKAVLNAKGGVDYPLTPDELKMHVELFAN